ncbi:roundabout homolog 1 isoform X2 [Oncorhynchus tshawytscha]|uniref:roundabout homolog 1 isoform X2 n=1 Tax=Oncorhynchus tshawytscha TaxID=74940 RepID=UPI000D0A2A27|nr:roundabout homolog 1 isoform X2 [Oncorhynchus tshawytscha]
MLCFGDLTFKMTEQVFTRLLVFFATLGNLAGSRLRTDVVEVRPRIVHHPSDVVVKVGSPATLSCRADGTPEPSIEWLRNGQPLEMDKLDSQSRPIVLSEGSLFFLSVVPGRRSQSHEGVYACMARNSAGKATSRNASLYIAALREDFRVQPCDVEVAVGEVAVMNCSPPVGHPEPNATWRKDGVPINNTNPHYTELNGKLIIAPAQKNDSGVYICVASNTVGVRESRAARLSVLAKPVLVLKPQDVSVGTGESAQFYCEAKGDPMPAVEWSRVQGPLPNGRYLVNPDQSLQIHYVTPQDSGRYTCTAVNDVGVVTASAQLVVEGAASTRQRDLHRELSDLRIALENVTVLTPNSNMSRVQWKLQSFPTQPQYLDGFELLYRSLLPASSDWAAKRVPLPNFQTLVGPLKRGYKYDFKVRPYGSSLYGRESNTRHLRVPETVPSAPPQAVSITRSPDHNDTVYVTWEPPPHKAHNGIIQGYQLWCVQLEEQQYLNWTVDSGTHSLEINPLYPDKEYWVQVAAVNGAGIGVQSDPHRLVIDSRRSGAPKSDSPSRDLTRVLAVLRNPVFIGSIGALLCCILMVTAFSLYRRHTRPGDHLGRGHGKAKGLYRLASEDLIIKHRMAAPDSPWISGAWRPAQSGEKYQGMWAQSQENPGFRKTTKKDPGSLDSAVPIVPDSCGVYGTFYVDLTGNGLKTFNSPTRCPKRPHCHTTSSSHYSQCGTEAVRTAVKTMLVKNGQALPPAQPKMGVLKESWEKNYKRELHAENSAPLVSSRSQALAVRGVPSKQRLSHLPSGGRSECVKPLASSRFLHHSASLHLVDMLPTPPPLPMEDTTDTHSLTSEEESSRSTKLMVDDGSHQSVCAASGLRGPPSNTTGFPSYSRLSTASYCLSLDEEQDTTMTSQEVTQYLELSPKAERRSTMPENPPSSSLSRPFSPTPTLGYICGLLPSDQLEDRLTDDQESQSMGSRRARLQSTPLSLCSEWEGSLWNGWGSVSEGNMANSARTSFISSSDDSFMNDANFAGVLATVAAESMSGASFSGKTTRENTSLPRRRPSVPCSLRLQMKERSVSGSWIPCLFGTGVQPGWRRWRRSTAPSTPPRQMHPPPATPGGIVVLTVTVRTAEPVEGVGFEDEDEGVGQGQPHSHDWIDDTFFVKSISMPRHAFNLLMICKVLIENQEKNYVILCFIHELGSGLCFPVSGLQQDMSRRCNWE